MEIQCSHFKTMEAKIQKELKKYYLKIKHILKLKKQIFQKKKKKATNFALKKWRKKIKKT